MSIENTLRNFIRSRDPGAIVLQGSWGIGKTYFWNRRIVDPFVADGRFRVRSRAYAYVSLFGIDSLTDLKAAIHQSIRENQAKLKWWHLLTHWASQWVPLLGSAAEPYAGRFVVQAYTSIAFFAIRNCLICLDDLERRGDGLALRDVLGLVSQLSEQRGCRVMVILNEGAFDVEDKATWDSYKEKVFSGELNYVSMPEQSIQLALDDVSHEPWHDRVRELMSQLGVSNIRIAHRVKRSVQQAIHAVKGTRLRNETIDHILKSVVLFVYCHAGKSEGAPPMAMVRRQPPYDMSFLVRDKKERTAEEEIWVATLNKYGHYHDGQLDDALDAMVTNGFPDNDFIAVTATIYDSQATFHANKEAWNATWRLYHDTLIDNSDELADAFERTWPPVSHSEHVRNLESLAGMLRTLGRPEVASKFIAIWVAQRVAKNIDELAPREITRFGPIKDPELLEAIDAAYTSQRPLPSLPEAIQAMSDRHAFDEPAISTLAATSATDLAEYLLSHHGDDQDQAITSFLGLKSREAYPNCMAASMAMRDALLIIASQSKFQAARIAQKYGVTHEEEPALS